MRGLQYAHSIGVYHQNLRPSKVLVDANCEVRISDFGLARPKLGDQDDQSQQMIEFMKVHDKQYQAPEILFKQQPQA